MQSEDADFEYDPEADDERVMEDDSEADDSEFSVSEDDSEAYVAGAIEADDETEADDSEAEDVDEDVDEASVSASAQLRADQDRSRRTFFAQQVAADRSRDARAAASTQRSLTSQIRSIQPGGPAKISSVGTISGPGVVMAVLPNGRRTQMRIIPTMAPVSEVNRLRNVVLVNERRQAVATARNSRAIRTLAATQAAAVKRLTAQQIKSDKVIGTRIVQSYNKLDKRITKELSDGTGSLGKHGKHVVRMLRQQRQRSIMNSVLLASAVPFVGAYHKKGDPFHRNNLILAGSLLGWLVGDELIDQFSGRSSTTLRGGANWWSYLAPIGNGATVYFLLKDRQHERFIGGVTPVSNTSTSAKVPLTAGTIGEDDAEAFKKNTHAATASVIEGTVGDVRASVVGGDLMLAYGAGATKIAWIVDTDDSVAVSVAS